MSACTNDALATWLLATLDGCSHAGAIMPWGKPGPICLPDDATERSALIEAHLRGGPATVRYCPSGKPGQRVQLDVLILCAFCPAADGLCRWIGFDLDAADGHGACGLIWPMRAAACIAERCDAAGLLDGLVVARSRSGKGRHLWLLTPQPVTLDEAVLVAAGLAVMALRVADRDAEETGHPHAFLCGDGTIATLGRSGSVEMIPHSTDRPALGWSLMLPAPGGLADHGGGTLVAPFTDQPVAVQLSQVPRCNSDRWQLCVSETRTELARRQLNKPTPPGPPYLHDATGSLSRVDPRTRIFIDGRCPVGERDRSLYIAVCNMIGVGMAVHETEQLALQGALACGLPEREARSTIRSAFRAKRAL